MEKLTKFVIYLGIGMVVTLFGMLLYATLPNLIINGTQDVDNYDHILSEEELLVLFESQPAYIAMYEKYPDAQQKLDTYIDGDAELRVGKINFKTNIELVLVMDYGERDRMVWIKIECSNTINGYKSFSAGLFADDYIRNGKCFEPLDSIDRGIPVTITLDVFPMYTEMVITSDKIICNETISGESREISFSKEAWQLLIMLVDMEKFYALPDRFGSPGSLDAPIYNVEIFNGVDTKSVSFEFRDIPEIHEFVTELNTIKRTICWNTNSNT